MHIVITGDFNRPGQLSNIARFADMVAVPISDEFGARAEVLARAPLPFDAWVSGYSSGPFDVSADLVIGFELPPAAKLALARWVDVRLHPIRYDGELWSLTTNVPNVARVVGRFALPVPATERQTKLAGLGVIALQVHSDAALLRDGQFVQPGDVMTDLLRWAGQCSRVLICPHPVEPQSPWTAPILRAVPHSEISLVSTYQAMAIATVMATVSSSTGVEARHFHCTPTFLWREPEHSPPVDITDPKLWREIAAVC